MELIITKSLYEDLALMSKNLTAPEYRVLVALLRDADGSDEEGRDDGTVPLANCFPTNREISGRIGRSDVSARIRLDSLEAKGWIRRHPMKLRPDGQSDGYQASNLYQFRIPPGEIEPGHPGWEGPVDFSQRESTHCLIH